MPFNGNEGDWITVADAKTITQNFRQQYPTEKQGAFLGCNKINDILRQNDCKGLRIYFAKNAAGELTVAVVGADSREADITALVLDVAQPCPPFCGSI
jgi:hypothetical protein